jgi:hypothetical protein
MPVRTMSALERSYSCCIRRAQSRSESPVWWHEADEWTQARRLAQSAKNDSASFLNGKQLRAMHPSNSDALVPAAQTLEAYALIPLRAKLNRRHAGVEPR